MSNSNKKPVILASLNAIGQKEPEVLGIAMGVSVRSQSQISGFFTKIRAIAGGRIGAYQKIVRDSRDEAIAEMLAEAESMGATHVLSFRFDSTEIKPSDTDAFVEITAYGTAVRFTEDTP